MPVPFHPKWKSVDELLALYYVLKCMEVTVPGDLELYKHGRSTIEGMHTCIVHPDLFKSIL